jgi:cytochrome c biogenesis protein CcmG/thiol:disulfide interchange protein DsbE
VKDKADWLLVGSIVLLVAALVYVVGGALQPRIVNAGDSAPYFKVRTDDGKTVTPTDFGGKLLVLNFWASWCPPCVAETPSLEEFAKEFAPRGVVVLGISSDTKADRYKKFLQRFGVTFETAMDPSADISASYGTFQIPETYIIDRNGKVLEKVISNQNWMDPEFLARIQKML